MHNIPLIFEKTMQSNLPHEFIGNTDMPIHVLQERFNSLSVDDEEALFNAALICWQKNQSLWAETYLRHASAKGHAQAKIALCKGIQTGDFADSETRLRLFSIQILEAFVSLQPTENQITDLEQSIKNFLTKHTASHLANFYKE